MGRQPPLPRAAAALLWGFLLPLVRGAGGLSGLPGAGPGPLLFLRLLLRQTSPTRPCSGSASLLRLLRGLPGFFSFIP